MSGDAELERLRTEWRRKARYRVLVSAWYPARKREALATGLPYDEAQRRAELETEALKARDPSVQGRFGDPIVLIELERSAAAPTIDTQAQGESLTS